MDVALLPYWGDEALTAAVLLAAAGVLGAIVASDLRTRRIPNKMVAALAVIWLLWRAALGGYACWMQATGLYSSFFPDGARFCMGAWHAQPLGLPSAADGLLAAAVLGGGLLVLALACEAVLKREALGGGDVKLVAALALFLGLGRGMLCLLAACAAALVWAAWRRARGPKPGGGPEALASPAAFPFAPALAFGAAVAVVPGIALWLAA